MKAKKFFPQKSRRPKNVGARGRLQTALPSPHSSRLATSRWWRRVVAVLIFLPVFSLLILQMRTSSESVVIEGLDKTVKHSFISRSLSNTREVTVSTKGNSSLPGINKMFLKFNLKPSELCDDPQLFLVSYIHSSPDHFTRRMAIRQTWGNPNNLPSMRTRVIFVVGLVDSDSKQKTLESENAQYGDILQADFKDSYKNLTYKGVSALKWISDHCKHVPFVLKSDDDIMINVYQLLRHLRSKQKHGVGTKKLILCLVWYGMKVMRDRTNKWYVPPELWAEATFPTYCSGSAFILSGDMITEMYQTALQVPFFWVDDLYITGLLVNKMGVVHESMHSTYIMDGRFTEHFGSKNFTTKIFGVNIGGANNMFNIWKVIQKSVRKIENGEPL